MIKGSFTCLGDTYSFFRASVSDGTPIPGFNATLAEATTPSDPLSLDIVSAEPTSPAERTIVLRVANAASGTPVIEQSSDLGLADPWTAVPGLTLNPIPDQPGVLEAILNRPVTVDRLFFRAVTPP